MKYSARGVVQSISFIQKDGGAPEVVSGYVFRNAYCQARHWGSLASLTFTLRFDGSGIVFTGSGLGHGIGLCQHGAMELARLGLSWERILRFYYPKLRCVAIKNS
jgi:stage II sporulation protein D